MNDVTAAGVGLMLGAAVFLIGLGVIAGVSSLINWWERRQ